MVKALVTGGTGFLGSHVARALLAAGHMPRILARSTSRLEALEGMDGYELVTGDILDVASLRAAMQGCDWVFHVAAVSDYWRQEVGWLYRVNVDGTRNVLQVAQELGIERLVYTSSAAAVGFRDDGRPADETVGYNLPTGAFPYAHSKFLAEIEVYKAVIAGLNCVIVNPAVIIGPGDLNLGSGSLLLEMAKGIVLATPAGGVTVIDVRDVARAHVQAAEFGRVPERYLLGAVNLSHKAWFALVADVLDVNPPRLRAPAWMMPLAASLVDLGRRLGLRLPANGTQLRLSGRRVFFDCQKSWRELGEPEVDIRQSLEDSCAWYRAHGML